MIREDVCVLQIFVCLVVSVKKHNKSFPHRHGNLAQGPKTYLKLDQMAQLNDFVCAMLVFHRAGFLALYKNSCERIMPIPPAGFQLVQAWPISRTIATQRFCKDAASCAYPAVQHTHGFAEHAALQVHDVLSLGRSYSYHSPGLVAFGVF